LKNKIGIIAIGISFLIALNPFHIYYAVSVFVFGLIWLWLGNKSLIYKIVWSIAPILLWYPSMYLFIESYLSIKEITRPKYDFIFPSNFMGTAVIVENMTCTKESKKQNGRIQLEFPKNGILLYRTKMESSYMDNKYYRRDSDGNLTELIDFHWAASENERAEQKSIGVNHCYNAVRNLHLPDRYIYTYSVLTVGFRDFKNSMILTQEKTKEIEALVKICTSINTKVDSD